MFEADATHDTLERGCGLVGVTWGALKSFLLPDDSMLSLKAIF
jgi:hypothetical protein